jgi:hypothetical protein
MNPLMPQTIDINNRFREVESVDGLFSQIEIRTRGQGHPAEPIK